jgi:ribosomal silencing factor RsfS
MDSKKLALLCRKLAENKKAENIVILDVRKLSSVTDYFVIVSGGKRAAPARHRQRGDRPIARGAQSAPAHVEGDAAAAWQVLDFSTSSSMSCARCAGEVRPGKPVGRRSARRRSQGAKKAPKTATGTD